MSSGSRARRSRDGESGPGYYFFRPAHSTEDELRIDEWTTEARKALIASRARHVRMQGWDQPTVAALADAGASIVRLSVNSGAKLGDPSDIAKLLKLDTLAMHGPIESIDFTRLPRLRYLGISLHGRQGLGNLPASKSLRELHITGGPFRDLGALSPLHRLETLSMSEMKLRSLDGIEGLRALRRLVLHLLPLERLDGLSRATRLEEVVLYAVRRVTSIEELLRLPALRSVKLDGLKKLEDLERLGKLRGIETLDLQAVGKIPSLAWMASLRALETFVMGEGTRIADGDLNVLLTLPLLRDVRFAPAKHYSHRAEAIRAALATR